MGAPAPVLDLWPGRLLRLLTHATCPRSRRVDRATSSCGRSNRGRTGGGAMPTSSSSDLEVPADLPETPDISGAYPRLTDEQLMTLSRYGERRSVPKGTMLFCEGDRTAASSSCWTGGSPWSRRPRAEPRLIAVHGPGRFLGDLSLLTGQAVLVTAVARPTWRSSRFAWSGSRRRWPQDQALGRPDPAGLHPAPHTPGRPRGRPADHRLEATRADTRRLRDFASRNRIPHQLGRPGGGSRGRGTCCVRWASHGRPRHPS